MRGRVSIILSAMAILLGGMACASEESPQELPHLGEGHDSLAEILDEVGEAMHRDSIPAVDSLSRYESLTDADFLLVAEQLGVEVAAIKAVVEIEAGKQMKGFYAPGIPVVNFDPSMYARCRQKAKGGKPDKGATVPKGLSGYALKEWKQLVNARHVNCEAADMGTFWGMFQIGGFNYRACGCESVTEMVRRMSYSELEQLELFAEFITRSGMLDDLKKKNWAGFARKYNGAGYARRGYHTRMAQAYARYKN